MQKNRHQYFRFTPRTARITFIYVCVVPAIMGMIAYKTDVRIFNISVSQREEAHG